MGDYPISTKQCVLQQRLLHYYMDIYQLLGAESQTSNFSGSMCDQTRLVIHTGQKWAPNEIYQHYVSFDTPQFTVGKVGQILQPLKLSLLLTVLPLYYRRTRAFESSRQKSPCSALPQQGKRRRKKNNNNQLLLPLLRKSRAGEFLVGAFKCACTMVIKRQDIK